MARREAELDLNIPQVLSAIARGCTSIYLYHYPEEVAYEAEIFSAYRSQIYALVSEDQDTDRLVLESLGCACDKSEPSSWRLCVSEDCWRQLHLLNTNHLGHEGNRLLQRRHLRLDSLVTDFEEASAHVSNEISLIMNGYANAQSDISELQRRECVQRSILASLQKEWVLLAECEMWDATPIDTLLTWVENPDEGQRNLFLTILYSMRQDIWFQYFSFEMAKSELVESHPEHIPTDFEAQYNTFTDWVNNSRPERGHIIGRVMSQGTSWTLIRLLMLNYWRQGVLSSDYDDVNFPHVMDGQHRLSGHSFTQQRSDLEDEYQDKDLDFMRSQWVFTAHLGREQPASASEYAPPGLTPIEPPTSGETTSAFAMRQTVNEIRSFINDAIAAFYERIFRRPMDLPESATRRRGM